MFYSKSQKAIALVVGVLAMAFLISYIILAWTEPGGAPPTENVPAPINVGSTAQTKAGALTVTTLTTSDGILYLNDSGEEGDIYRVNIIYGGSGNDLHLRSNEGTDNTGIYLVNTATDKKISFYFGGTEKWKIDSTGSLATGTVPWARLDDYPTGCAANEAVQVIGDTLTCIDLPTVPTDNITGSGTANYLAKFTGTNTIGDSPIYIDVDGNVGIGTATPGAKLEVASPVSGVALKVGRVSGQPSIQGTSDWFILDNAGASPLALNYWSSSNVVLAQGGGNVGIGTAEPKGKLDVRGKTYINPRAGFYSEPTIDLAVGDTDTGLKWVKDGHLDIYTNNAARLKIDNSGNVEIPTGNLTVGGNVNAAAFYYTSDASLKTDISPLENSLEKVMNLEGVSFNWKNGGKQSIGLIAQDVEKILPEVVNTDNGLKYIDYGKLTALLIEAIKEQQKEIELLKAEIEK